jgi:CRP-like cAMP-binding protein
LETVSRLDEEDRQALRGLPVRTRAMEENRDILREGSTSSECCLVLSGVVCRYKIVAGGRRQILSFHFAGDMPDLHRLLIPTMDHSLSVLTRSEVAFIPFDAIRTVAACRPALAAAFHRQALVDGSIFREWLANVGRRLAPERVAHLICECFARMRALGLADENTFELPVTQSELGDATGLSNVHINRTMQGLRRAGLVVSQGRVHTIPDWSRLREAADFNSGYLHLLPPLAA